MTAPHNGAVGPDQAGEASSSATAAQASEPAQASEQGQDHASAMPETIELCANAPEREAPSLRRKLLWLIFAVVLIASFIQALAVYRIALRETEAVFDSQMQRMALSLSGGLASSIDETSVLEGAHAQDWIVQIWRADGTMLYRSASARLLPQPIPALMAAASNLMKAVAYRL